MHLLSFQHVNQGKLFFDCIEQIDQLFLIFFIIFQPILAAIIDLLVLDLLKFKLCYALIKLVHFDLFFCETLQRLALFSVD